MARAAYQLRGVLRRRFRPVLALRHVEAERAALGQRLRALRAADPDAALARGFSLTYTADGELVRSVDDLRAGQATLTRLADGQLESVVRKILEGKHG